jgi:hypothetical protein
MNKGTATLFAAGALLLSACNGWPTTRPFQQAVNMPEHYITYTPSPAESVPMFYAGNHRYMVMPTPASFRSARTASVATGESVSVFALEGDEAPFSTLFSRGADGRVHAVSAID